MLSPAEIVEQLETEVPDDFFRRALGGLFLAFDAADSEARAEHEPTEAHDLIGHLRRAKFEAQLRGAAQLCRLEVQNVVVGRHASHHLEVTSKTFVFLSMRSDAPGATPRHACFRETLAASGQGEFWPAEADEAGGRVAAMFAYTKSQWTNASEQQKWGHLPGSLHLVFPSPDLKAYVHTIDLFDRFKDVVKAHSPADWDEPMLLRYIHRGRRQIAA